MEFSISDRARDYLARLQEFMDAHIYPAEPLYTQYRAERGPDDHTVPPLVEELKQEARRRGLWNLFLPSATDPPHGLAVLDYAPLAELTGRSPALAPRAVNSSAGHREHGVAGMFASPSSRSGGCTRCWRAAFARLSP